MCKYCKHLKELRNNDILAQEKLLSSWRRNNKKAEEYLKQSVAVMLLTCPRDPSGRDAVISLCAKILKFIRPDIV